MFKECADFWETWYTTSEKLGSTIKTIISKIPGVIFVNEQKVHIKISTTQREGGVLGLPTLDPLILQGSVGILYIYAQHSILIPQYHTHATRAPGTF